MDPWRPRGTVAVLVTIWSDWKRPCTTGIYNRVTTKTASDSHSNVVCVLQSCVSSSQACCMGSTPPLKALTIRYWHAWADKHARPYPRNGEDAMVNARIEPEVRRQACSSARERTHPLYSMSTAQDIIIAAKQRVARHDHMDLRCSSSHCDHPASAGVSGLSESHFPRSTGRYPSRA